MNRRNFIKTTILAGLGIILSPLISRIVANSTLDIDTGGQARNAVYTIITDYATGQTYSILGAREDIKDVSGNHKVFLYIKIDTSNPSNTDYGNVLETQELNTVVIHKSLYWNVLSPPKSNPLYDGLKLHYQTVGGGLAIDPQNGIAFKQYVIQ